MPVRICDKRGEVLTTRESALEAVVYGRLAEMTKDTFTSLRNVESLVFAPELDEIRGTCDKESDEGGEVLVAGLLEPLHSLRSLTLCHKAIRFVEPGAFSGMRHLRSLELHHNRISSLHPETFGELTSLENLDLAANGLVDLPRHVFSNLGALWFLSLERNKLHRLDAATLDECRSLVTLNLSYNQLESLPVGLGRRSEHLVRIDLEGNPMTRPGGRWAMELPPRASVTWGNRRKWQAEAWVLSTGTQAMAA